MTYPYQILGSNTNLIKEIVSGNHKISEKIKKAKKPLIIIGESALNETSGEYIFEAMKKFIGNNL